MYQLVRYSEVPLYTYETIKRKFPPDSSEEQRPKVDIGRVIPLRKQLGFLRMLSMILAVLGPRVRPHLPTFLSLLLALVHHHQTILDHSRHLVRPLWSGLVFW